MPPTSKKHIVIGGLLAVAVLIVGALLFMTQKPGAQVHLGGQTFVVQVADTNEERQRGLSNTEPLQPNEGMLFVFNTDDHYGIWMKDMNYPIDILWLNKDKVVVSVAENVSPDTYPESFASSEPARYVVELPAGTLSKHSIGVGAIAEF